MADGGRGRGLLRLAVIGAALLLGAQLIRSAAVSFDYAHRPAFAAGLWPDHPRILLDRGMATIGLAAAAGRGVPPSAQTDIERVTRKAPLRAEPFLVQGAIAQMEGREEVAERLFVAARNRDPRARAARYFLADRYLRTGRIQQGLMEMAVLVRLVPGSATAFTPALAAYAESPGGLDEIESFFRNSPDLKPQVLETLAHDPANAGLVLRLAGPGPIEPSAAEQWQRVLLAKLVEVGEFDRAHAIWQQVNGVRSSGGLFNPGFRDLSIGPPFNWVLQSGGAALAEPIAGDRLQVVYYGRDNAVLASQLLLLEPGRYRLGMEANGEFGDGALRWLVRCHPDNRVLLELPIGRERTSGGFSVPSGCAAQVIELAGRPTDFPETIELTIGRLTLVRERQS